MEAVWVAHSRQENRRCVLAYSGYGGKIIRRVEFSGNKEPDSACNNSSAPKMVYNVYQ